MRKTIFSTPNPEHVLRRNRANARLAKIDYRNVTNCDNQWRNELWQRSF